MGYHGRGTDVMGLIEVYPAGETCRGDVQGRRDSAFGISIGAWKAHAPDRADSVLRAAETATSRVQSTIRGVQTFRRAMFEEWRLRIDRGQTGMSAYGDR